MSKTLYGYKYELKVHFGNGYTKLHNATGSTHSYSMDTERVNCKVCLKIMSCDPARIKRISVEDLDRCLKEAETLSKLTPAQRFARNMRR